MVLAPWRTLIQQSPSAVDDEFFVFFASSAAGGVFCSGSPTSSAAVGRGFIPSAGEAAATAKGAATPGGGVSGLFSEAPFSGFCRGWGCTRSCPGAGFLSGSSVAAFLWLFVLSATVKDGAPLRSQVYQTYHEDPAAIRRRMTKIQKGMTP